MRPAFPILRHCLISLVAAGIGVLGFRTATSAAATNAELLFVQRIAPLLHEKCLGCHGADEKKRKGGLDLQTLEGALKGGDSSTAAIKPGRPEESPLYLAASRTHAEWEPMPPKETDKLTAPQLAWVREWILRGAAWPDEGRAQVIAKAAPGPSDDSITMKTSGGLSAEWTERRYQRADLWAYQPLSLRMPGSGESGTAEEQAGKGRDTAGSGNPIDLFIRARWPSGLKGAPPADRISLIRRASFDLTGLPPKVEEVEAFGRDALPDAEAFGKVIERFLASPHYGERMAQHWLDVVRYADSSGFANDYERGNAWRYRDYVVRSFNQDKPYDQFVREQIAGDELDSENPELLVATGFLRMGPWELTGMEVPKVARQRFLDDVVSSVGETFLAHSLQCARCHDHKFDPVPTRDYYSIQAVFATTQLSERAAPFLPEDNLSGFEEKKYLEFRREEYQETLRQLDEKMLAAADTWFAAKGMDRAKWDAAVEKARGQPVGGRRAFADVFGKARNALMKAGVPESEFPPKFYGFTPEDYGNDRVARKGLERLRWELDRYKPFALAVHSGRTPEVDAVYAPVRMPDNRLTAGEMEETTILSGGDPFSPAAKVKPSVLSVLDPAGTTAIPETIEGRRKAFADWVASPNNPLTARTIVNRIWLWHFGQPIAGHPNNFGASGKKPSHPELLDWLAATLVENGWSVKAMHRLIMQSEAYRRAAHHPDRQVLMEKDPEGTSYAVFKPRRLSGEELRDAMLAASGELNPVLGGIPNRPEVHWEVALQPRQVMGTFAAAWTPNPLPQQRHRRSLYALKLRGLPDPFLEVFNAPAPDFSCERRESSTITPQVFSLFNGQSIHDRALALAHRVVQETQTDEEAIARCFLLAFSRRPTAREVTSCLEHWREIEARLGEAPPVSKPPLKVRRDAVEENTGEPFSFEERLHACAEFVSDLQPGDVPKRTRALADVCLVLFNSNEFAYVY